MDEDLFNEDDAVGTVEELEAQLKRSSEVSRDLRRAMVSDARRFCRLLADDGAAPGSVRFRTVRCCDCGMLELRVFSNGMLRRRKLH